MRNELFRKELTMFGRQKIFSSKKQARLHPLIRESITILVTAGIIVGVFFGANMLLVSAMGTESPIVVVSSGSMQPTLSVGDICLIQHREPEKIEVGDIIVFQATWLSDTSFPVIHRVVNITILNGTYYFTTQGDNTLTNPYPDPALAPGDRVYGVVVFTLPRIGMIILWLREGSNYLFVSIMLVSLIVLSFLWDYICPGSSEKPSGSEDAFEKPG
ncbi:MAG: signal peptidase I [Candidatus Ranarchaeia archaeon]